MTNTRRKSRAAAAEEDADAANTQLTISLPDDLDEDVLLDILPDINLTALTPQDVIALYRAVVAQAANTDNMERERDEIRAELERKDIELDQALQDKEMSSKDMEVSAESVHEELNQVKKQRDQLGTWLHKFICTLALTLEWQLNRKQRCKHNLPTYQTLDHLHRQKLKH